MCSFAQPIFQNHPVYNNYPFENLESSVLEVFEKATNYLFEFHQKRINRLLKMLEAYLQITEQRLKLHDLDHPKAEQIFTTFIGALYSKRFIDISESNSYTYSSTLDKLLSSTKQYVPQLFDFSVKISSIGATREIQRFTYQFEQMSLNEEKVWLWSAWKSTNRNGKNTFFPLYPLYKRIGRGFTERFFECCDDYFSGRKGDKIECISSLANFILNYSGQISEAMFQDRQFVGKFWREFFVYFVRTGFDNGFREPTLISQWRRFKLGMIELYLFKSGLMVRPWGELPNPEPRHVSGTKTHIKTSKSGHEVKTKLLTHIPLQVSDNEAMRLLFDQLEADIDVFITWARYAVADIWYRYKRRKNLARDGKTRFLKQDFEYFKKVSTQEKVSWLTNRKNPEFVQNACSTFEHYGFLTSKEISLSLLYPRPLSQAAYDLALPTSAALLPHCVLLVVRHPEITPGFLEKLELFDKNGKQTGFIKIDAGYKLVGRKDRRGSKLANQIVSLTEETAEIVKAIIALTQPLRSYLRKRNDDNWRFLFLSSKKGFSYPSKISRFATTTSRSKIVSWLAEELGKTSPLAQQERLQLSANFSLPTLRASAGVLVYLKTLSVEKMAKALGHTRYDPRLIQRYLPQPLQQFFQERWINIFQESLIIESLKDSNFLLEASSFSSIDQVEEFLKNHSLKLINNNGDSHTTGTISSSPKPHEVVFGLDTNIFTILLSIKAAVEKTSKKVNPTAKYWASIAKHVIAIVESPTSSRHDLKRHLALAKEKANPSFMEHIIYA